jgi:hypothetical protein
MIVQPTPTKRLVTIAVEDLLAGEAVAPWRAGSFDTRCGDAPRRVTLILTEPSS